MDMHSGGSSKEYPHQYIYIEAPLDEAKIIFFNRFGHNPDRVSCTCCGPDYSIGESNTLEDATGYERNCEFNKEDTGYIEEERKGRYHSGKYITVSEYCLDESVLIIREDGISDDEREGDIPEEGYVWVS